MKTEPIRAAAQQKLMETILYDNAPPEETLTAVAAWRRIVGDDPATYIKNLFTKPHRQSEASSSSPAQPIGFFQKKLTATEEKLAAAQREVARLKKNETSTLRHSLDTKNATIRELRHQIDHLFTHIHALSKNNGVSCVCPKCKISSDKPEAVRSVVPKPVEQNAPIPVFVMHRRQIVAEALGFLTQSGLVVIRDRASGVRHQFQFTTEAFHDLMGTCSISELETFESALKAYPRGQEDQARSFAEKERDRIKKHGIKFELRPKINNVERRLQLTLTYDIIKLWEVGEPQPDDISTPSRKKVRRTTRWSEEEFAYLAEQYEALGCVYRSKMDYTKRLELADRMQAKFGAIRDWKGTDGNCGSIMRGLMTLWQQKSS